MNKLSDTALLAILTAICLFLAFSVINRAEARENRIGISITVPLNLRLPGERGTITIYGEVYDADRCSYTAIDNSITTVDSSVDNRVTTTDRSNTTNTTLTVTQSSTTISNTTNSNTCINTNGINNHVQIH